MSVSTYQGIEVSISPGGSHCQRFAKSTEISSSLVYGQCQSRHSEGINYFVTFSKCVTILTPTRLSLTILITTVYIHHHHLYCVTTNCMENNIHWADRTKSLTVYENVWRIDITNLEIMWNRCFGVWCFGFWGFGFWCFHLWTFRNPKRSEIEYMIVLDGEHGSKSLLLRHRRCGSDWVSSWRVPWSRFTTLKCAFRYFRDMLWSGT